MVTTDLVVIWPQNMDYPPFRVFVMAYRELFNEIIIVFTDYPSNWDFTEDVMGCMAEDRITFMWPKKGQVGDWRDIATNQALDYSKADRVLFMEQDFLIKDDKTLEYTLEYAESEVVALKQEERIHPAFMLVPRDLIERTSRDFSANPEEGYDHFGKFTKELEALTEIATLEDIGFEPEKDFKHMNGLTHNFNLCMEGKPKNIYKKDEFIWYLDHSEINADPNKKYFKLLVLCRKVLGIKKAKKGQEKSS